MEIEGHGGGCCGMTHLYGFEKPAVKGPNYGYWKPGNLEGFKHFLKTFLDDQYDDSQKDGYEGKYDYGDGDYEEFVGTGKKFSCILEVTLTDKQMVDWAPHLKEAGFKIVNRFLNSNSGNVVNVLHYNPAGRRKIPEAPYKW